MAYLLPENGDRARTGREVSPEKKDRRGVLYIKSYELFFKEINKRLYKIYWELIKIFFKDNLWYGQGGRIYISFKEMRINNYV